MNNFSFYKDGKAFYCLIFLVFFLSFPPVSASSIERRSPSFFQQHQVQGTITDGASPLPGVTIAIKNKLKSSTISDFTGQYSLLVSPSDTLVVSFMGFKTALVPVNGRTTVNVKLGFDTTTLQEVRVNAGYYSTKQSERTGSISSITSKDIDIQPVTNVLAAMQGRMAGVSITQTTGIPGGNFEIKIRGQNSLRAEGNAPLYIIDGVPYASDPIGSAQISTLFPYATGALNGINPEQIQSIEVLKDADATSIYGSRGANGVVLITTKKGQKGKTKFTLSASSGAGKVTQFVKMMDTNQYLAMRRRAFANDGITDYPESAYDINGTWDQNRNTNWQKELLGGTSLFTDMQGSVSGGSANTNFYLSGNYHSESTVFPGDFLYKKGGGQFNMNHQSEDQKFKIQFSAGYTLQDNDQPSFDLTTEARTIAPNAPELYNPDGTLNWANSTWQNPLRNLPAKFESKTHDFLANTMLSYEVLPGLLLKTSMGYTNLRHGETRLNPSTIYDPAFHVGSSSSSLILGSTSRNSWIIEPQLNWERAIGNHKLGLLLGGTFQQQSTAQLVESGTGFSSNSLIYNLAAASRIKILTDNAILYKYQAFFGRLNYNWKERYIVNLTARRDGSSRFGPGNQFATFGAIGAAWLFSKESFLTEFSWLSFGKLRGSYGTTGSDQIGDYQFLDTYATSGVLYGGKSGLAPSRLYNPNFAWETNRKLELALETGFLQDRIFFTAAWYRNRSSNQLVGIPMPGTTGFSSLQSNLEATVQNAGWEFTLRTVNLSKGAFGWTSSLNLSFSRNKLLRFPGLEGSTYSEKYRLNAPLNITLLYEYTGIDPKTGLYQFRDINNDGKISFPDDKQIVMDLNPQYYGGLQNQLSYKGWSLDFLFQFVKQKNVNYPVGATGEMYNQPEVTQHAWQQPGDLGPYQIQTAGYNFDALTAGSLYSESTASISDASFIRLKNISLWYDLPLKQTKCRLMIQGQNLLTFTGYRDGDPEFTSFGSLPPLRVITAGVQFTF
ncbi:TonB-dependent receptor P26 [Flavobacterium bizetiae]|uniref:TonB-dependent receptor P26 n=1 Tax=Flavobacterium bizetiae TaxID=2704140 RepID=A0A6J4G9D3_9FLAO|nr:SusC/RagA family TonB-linked outer membrane protein [Flavobacterium bizetiae]CAA9194667.1 TonB-dependent receptor P26 [Flavobacterium bizetiae]CAD5343610.1 TonB-dependent receptor P26 [Flavobacterium bizetiae]CAD5347803.1 TonB-dependent receptor P26 [Flavobacterium bizetiae]